MSRTRFVSILAMSISVAFVATVASAWTGPTGAPPNNNVAAPINTSASGQTKTGDFATLGKVGIGTITPSASFKLDVYNGTASTWKAYFHGSEGGISIGPANASWSHIYTDNPMQPFLFNANITSVSGVFSSYSGDLTLGTNFSATSTTPRLTIQQSTGNVGIGNTNPGYKLSVAGTNPAINVHDNSAPAAGVKGAIGFTRLRASDGAIESMGYIQSVAENNQVLGGLRFVTRNGGDVETMRMSSGGVVTIPNNLVIGTGPNSGAKLNVDSMGAGVWAQLNNYNAGSPLGAYGIWSYGSSYALYGSGPVYGASFLYLSDARLKHNVQNLDKGILSLMQLRPVTFTWNDNAPDGHGGKDDIGFIAQEMEQVVPEAVHTDPETTYKEIDYPRLVPILVKAIQDQQKQIDDLTARLEALEAKGN